MIVHVFNKSLGYYRNSCISRLFQHGGDTQQGKVACVSCYPVQVRIQSDFVNFKFKYATRQGQPTQSKALKSRYSIS